MKIKVKVPATSANLGAGFDVFGLAVNLFNEFIVEKSDRFEIIINGDKGTLPINQENLFYKSFKYLFEREKLEIPQVKITMNIRIPQGRGLGSSATAVVGGLLSANVFLGNKYNGEDLLPFAIKLEHGNNPDNVSPALFGELIVITSEDKKIICTKNPFPQNLKAVYFIPDFEMDTAASRKLMPKIYSKEDVVFSTGRVALFLSAIHNRQYNLLRIAMQDRIHQPTRAKIFPQMPKLIGAALNVGAYGAALSGGGSSIIAFADHNLDKIAQSMKLKAKENNISGKSMVVDINKTGALVS